MGGIALDRPKSLGIDPRAANQADVGGIDQSGAVDGGAIVGVLQDQAAVRAAEGQAQQGADRGPQQAGLEAVAGEDVAEAGDGVDAGGDAGQAGGQSAVDYAFDGEVVGEIGAFLGVELTDVLEQGEFAQGVQAAPLHRDGEGAEAGGLESGDVGAGRGEHDDVMAVVVQVASQRQAEVVEIPFGIGEEEDFHG